MPQQNYLDELTPAFTPLLAIKEASRGNDSNLLLSLIHI